MTPEEIMKALRHEWYGPGGMPEYHNMIQTMRSAASLIVQLQGERDNARAECAWLAKRLLKHRYELGAIADKVSDEGGRVYFGQTIHADFLKEIAEAIEEYDFDRITRASKWPDYIETSRKTHERAEAAEQALADAVRAERERCERIVKNFYIGPATSRAANYREKNVTRPVLAAAIRGENADD